MNRNETTWYDLYYSGWQKRRIEKIEHIFGKDFFKDKTLLELACGYGDIGKHFNEKLGSKVTFAEGREEHIPFIRNNNAGCEVILLNQEYNWNLNKKFDIIIHFGVMYHLDNWKQDLECTMKHTDLIILESEIADSNNMIEKKVIDPVSYDQAINENRIATRPSASYVEKVFSDNGFTFTRYDDADLNDGIHRYDWEVTGDADRVDYNRSDGGGMRRFWVARKT